MQDEKISREDQQSLFTCTKCEGCRSVCPQHLPLIQLYDWGRQTIVSKYGFVNSQQQSLIQNITQFGNPFNEEGPRFKHLYALSPERENQVLSHQTQKEQQNSTPNEHSSPQILLHLGCMLNYRMTSMATDLLDILTMLGIKFALDEKESCCGYYVWNCGDHSAANEVIQQNIEYMDNYSEIYCACAGCYTFFRTNYPESIQFTHIIEKIAEQIPSFLQTHPYGVARLTKANHNKEKVLLHDPCHLTRPWGIIEPPRDILKSLGHELTEMPHSRDKSLCCGADGGMRFVNKDLALQIGHKRVEEATTKASVLSTICPFCFFNFREANDHPKELQIESLYAKIAQDLRAILQFEESGEF